jgi:hypothetical protein
MAASYDKLAGVLTAACLVAQGLLAPWGTRRFGHTVTTTVTTTVRVVGSILNDTTNGWTNTLTTAAAGFTDLDVLVLFVTDYT